MNTHMYPTPVLMNKILESILEGPGMPPACPSPNPPQEFFCHRLNHVNYISMYSYIIYYNKVYLLLTFI